MLMSFLCAFIFICILGNLCATSKLFHDPCTVVNSKIERGRSKFFFNGTDNSGICEIWTCPMELEEPKGYICEDLEALHTEKMEPILISSPDIEIMHQSCGMYHCLSRGVSNALEEIEREQEVFEHRLALLLALKKNETLNADQASAMNKSISEALNSNENQTETNMTLATPTNATQIQENGGNLSILTNHTLKKRELRSKVAASYEEPAYSYETYSYEESPSLEKHTLVPDIHCV